MKIFELIGAIFTAVDTVLANFISAGDKEYGIVKAIFTKLGLFNEKV